MITVEQEGVDGHHVDVKEFMDHYTRSNRLKDHQSVLDHLFKNPVKGWNGKWIFFGVSEGGPIATTLTTRYPDEVLATINWAGAGDFSWREDLWQFIQKMDQTLPWYFKVRAYLPSWMPFAIDLYFPKSRAEHEHALDQTIANPTPALKLAGMTYGIYLIP